MATRDYQRPSLELLRKHLGTPNPPIQVVLGPRQVGKTTGVLDFLKEWAGPTFYSTADQLSPPDAAWIEQQWVGARRGVVHQKNPGLLVLDEVQKISRWSEVVKKCYDEDDREGIPLKVVLLGSSSLLVQRGLTESLAGRFEIIPFPHWSFQECRQCFGITLHEYLFYGGYPGALQLLLDSDRDTQRWGAFVRNALIETVLSKDILLLTPVTKPALFRQVFFLSCMHVGEILSLNKMLGQLQEAGNASTVASYLRLLEAAMLLKPLEKYSGNRLRQKISSPKLLLLNNALVNATLQRDLQQVQREPSLWGRLLENSVGASLVNNNVGKGIDLFYWRDREYEVDFVVQKGEEVLGIEVKTDPTASQSQEGLRMFRKRFQGAKGMTTALGGGDIPIERLLDMPVQEIFARARNF